MRYHYEKPDEYSSKHGKVYICFHPVYYRCTLYEKDGKGLAVIQQRFDNISKKTWWSEIDAWLVDDIYQHPKFNEFFDKRAGLAKDGLYPTVTIRQIMWALRMKPMTREQWETYFDRKEV